MRKQLTAATFVASLALAGCTVGVAVKPDPRTGYLVSNGGSARVAEKVVAKQIDMAKYQPLALVTAGNFAEEQVRDLNYFGEVIDLAELQKRIVSNNLQDKVPAVNDRIGLSNAARHYRPFLWIRYETVPRGGKQFAQLIATDPATLDDVFITERELDYVWKGVNDQNTYYPMFNAFIEWLRENRPVAATQ